MSVAFKAMSEVAFFTLWVIAFAVNLITLAVFILRCIITREAFTDLAVNTVTITTTLRAVRHITDQTSPPCITLTLIRLYRISMLTRWVTGWLIATCPFIPVEAPTNIRGSTDSVNTFLANTDTANRTLPTSFTLTIIRTHA